MRANRVVPLLFLVSVAACAESLSVEPADRTDAVLSQVPVRTSYAKSGQDGLRLLAVFETPPGLSPDDLAFRTSMGGPRLVATAMNPANYLYEMTLDGELIVTYADLGGWSLTRGTRGWAVDHFFQASGGGGSLSIRELDRDYGVVRDCNVDISGSGSTVPCDGLAYDHHRGTFVATDTDANLLLEVDCSTGTVGSLVRVLVPDGFPAPAGLVYDESTRTFLGVLHGPAELVQFDHDGGLIRRIDLKPFGVQQPVGITVGEGKIFVADELKGDLNDTTGYIYVFKLGAVIR